jgi:hypothetical protein
MSDQSGYFDPQLSPDINPVVQKLANLIRNGGDITDPKVFVELLEGQYNDLTGEDLREKEKKTRE